MLNETGFLFPSNWRKKKDNVYFTKFPVHSFEPNCDAVLQGAVWGKKYKLNQVLLMRLEFISIFFKQKSWVPFSKPSLPAVRGTSCRNIMSALE